VATEVCIRHNDGEVGMDDDPNGRLLLQTSDVRLARGDTFSIGLPDLALKAGEAVAVIGPSGCGKTTALMALAGIRPPESGVIAIDGINPWDLPSGARDRFCGRRIGLVFQSFHLVDALSVAANILLAAIGAGSALQTAERLKHLASKLDISEILSQRADRISYGQAQRVAIARALMNKPAVLLADEPTSALDDGHTESLLALLLQMAKAEAAALVIATHDRRVLSVVNSVVELQVLS
jgi:putative ABC transport system ATP-binding protein